MLLVVQPVRTVRKKAPSSSSYSILFVWRWSPVWTEVGNNGGQA